MPTPMVLFISCLQTIVFSDRPHKGLQSFEKRPLVTLDFGVLPNEDVLVFDYQDEANPSVEQLGRLKHVLDAGQVRQGQALVFLIQSNSKALHLSEFLRRYYSLVFTGSKVPQISLSRYFEDVTPFKAVRAIDIAAGSTPSYQAIPLTKPRFVDGKFQANGYTFVHQTAGKLQFTVSVIGFHMELMSPVYDALIERFQAFQAKIVVRSVNTTTADHQDLIMKQSFQESMRDPALVYAGLPEELRAKLSLEDWTKAAQGIAGLLDQ